ncbi:DNA sulfur modification protein DndB [Sporosarcina sp. FSL K6-1508]|uniref:DNA sulfur modification protein DndB n=1 Tax=Sporosarcina sp. FSL K6-1508 TaxID=2921553 RepID=UPI0030F8DD7B
MSNTGVLAKLRGTMYNQFGKQVLSTQIRFSTLEAMFEIDHEVQRQLDPRRRAEIRDFIMDSIEKGKHFYFSTFIFSSRKGLQQVDGGFELEPGSKVYVIDGQHRTSALSSAISHFKSQKEVAEEAGDYEGARVVQGYIDSLMSYPVAMQVYLELDQKEERQMFTDYNTERINAHKGLVMQYDQRDEYIELTRQVANQLKSSLDIEFEQSRLTAQNSAITSLTTMRKCLIAMFEGIIGVKTGTPYYRGCKPTEVPKIAKQFFQSWTSLFPRKMANRKQYVTGLTGIQIALATTVYTLTRENSITHIEAINMLKLLNKQCTWRHDDPLFAHMYDHSSQRITSHSTTTAINKTLLRFLLVINQERGKLNDYQ